MALVYILCSAYALFCLATMPAGPITAPDSAHYLSFSPIVPLGYPLFLSVVGVRGAMFVQTALYAASLALLGRETVLATRRTSLAVGVVLGGMLVPQIVGFHASILSESLFLSALVLLLALMVRFVNRPSWQLMVAMALTVGTTATIRRTAYAWLPVLLIMALSQRHRLKASWPVLVCAAAIAPFLLIVASEGVAARMVHGSGGSSLTGRHLFAKAALVEAPPALPSGDSLQDSLEEHLATRYAPIRELLARAPADVRAVMTIYYETCLQGPCVDASRALVPDRSEAVQTRALGAAATARLVRAPLSFAQLTALHVRSLWTVERLRHPATATALAAFMEANRPLPFEREAFSLEPGVAMTLHPAPWVRYVQPAVWGIGMFTAAWAAAGLIVFAGGLQAPPLMGIAMLAALVAHGSLLFTALLAAGLARFAIGVWPAVMMAAMFGAWGLVVEWRTSRPPTAAATGR